MAKVCKTCYTGSIPVRASRLRSQPSGERSLPRHSKRSCEAGPYLNYANYARASHSLFTLNLLYPSPNNRTKWPFGKAANAMLDTYYVYILESIHQPLRHYTGMTQDLTDRLKKHNEGGCPHTAKFRPWRLRTAISFHERARAAEFEKYLKSHSGRAFAAKHF